MKQKFYSIIEFYRFSKTVVTNIKEAPASNYELSLIFDFESMDDLNAYQKNPRHLEFGNFIKSVREDRACIDFEI